MILTLQNQHISEISGRSPSRISNLIPRINPLDRNVANHDRHGERAERQKSAAKIAHAEPQLVGGFGRNEMMRHDEILERDDPSGMKADRQPQSTAAQARPCEHKAHGQHGNEFGENENSTGEMTEDSAEQ